MIYEEVLSNARTCACPATAAEGVRVYAEKLVAKLEDAMAMCGAHSLSEITRDMVR